MIVFNQQFPHFGHVGCWWSEYTLLVRFDKLILMLQLGPVVSKNDKTHFEEAIAADCYKSHVDEILIDTCTHCTVAHVCKEAICSIKD